MSKQEQTSVILQEVQNWPGFTQARRVCEPSVRSDKILQ